MKKILTMVLALALIFSLAMPAYAYDGTNTTYSWGSWWDWWDNMFPSNPSEPTDPSEPEAAMLGTPTITESRFYHSASVASLRNRLQIKWDAVENAESYEIEVVKADGTVKTYTASTNFLMVKSSTCPKVYIESTSTWTAATVRVRAIAGDSIGEWSDAAKIGCDAIH